MNESSTATSGGTIYMSMCLATINLRNNVVSDYDTAVPKWMYYSCLHDDGRQIPYLIKTGVVDTFKLITT